MVLSSYNSYIDAGHAMLEHNIHTPATPSWMILDGRHRNRFMFHKIPPFMTPKQIIDQGFFIKASTIQDLAVKCKIPPQNLEETIEPLINLLIKVLMKILDEEILLTIINTGIQLIIPNLGRIEKAPFWAVRIYPGDLGTKGGFVTDAHGRVLKNGKPIIGLYAAGKVP